MSPPSLLAEAVRVTTPDVGLFTRYLLENPWPLGGVLLLVAVVSGWVGFREGRRGHQRAFLVCGALGLLVIALASLVTTSGEHARQVTRDFVDAIVGNDLVAAETMIADDGSFTFGSRQNPGLDKTFIMDNLSWLSGAYRIDDNTITLFRSFTIGPEDGEVHLACLTEASAAYSGSVVTRWIVEVRRQADGSWKIRRLVWISLNGDPPQRQILRGG